MTNPSFSQPWNEQNRVVQKELEKSRRRTLSPKRAATSKISPKSPSFRVQNSIVGTRPTHWSTSHPSTKKQKRSSLTCQYSNNILRARMKTASRSKDATIRKGPLSSMVLNARKMPQVTTKSFTPVFLDRFRDYNQYKDDDPKEYTNEETATATHEDESEEKPFWVQQQQQQRRKKRTKIVGPLSQKMAQLRSNRSADELRLKSGGVMIHDPRRQKQYLDVKLVSPSPVCYHTSTMTWLGKRFPGNSSAPSGEEVWVVVRNGSPNLPSQVRIYNPILVPKNEESTHDVVIVTQFFEALPVGSR